MKIITLTIVISLTCMFQSIGQINPITNLFWDHHYIYPNNFFELTWEEPAIPHDELIGYNVYRENELYRFQTENSLYNLEQGSNCGEDFLLYNNGQGFFAHVTAVYNPGEVESDYTETVFVEGPLLEIKDFNNQKVIIYPNPSNGIINIGNKNLKKIVVYDITGKKIKELKASSQIDLSDVTKGIYLINLISDDGVTVNKIVLQ